MVERRCNDLDDDAKTMYDGWMDINDCVLYYTMITDVCHMNGGRYVLVQTDANDGWHRPTSSHLLSNTHTYTHTHSPLKYY